METVGNHDTPYHISHHMLKCTMKYHESQIELLGILKLEQNKWPEHVQMCVRVETWAQERWDLGLLQAVPKGQAVVGDLGDAVEVHEGCGDDEHVEDLVALELCGEQARLAVVTDQGHWGLMHSSSKIICTVQDKMTKNKHMYPVTYWCFFAWMKHMINEFMCNRDYVQQ